MPKLKNKYQKLNRIGNEIFALHLRHQMDFPLQMGYGKNDVRALLVHLHHPHLLTPPTSRLPVIVAYWPSSMGRPTAGTPRPRTPRA